MWFRVLFKGGCLPWMNAAEWTLQDMKQWEEFPDYQIEYSQTDPSTKKN